MVTEADETVLALVGVPAPEVPAEPCAPEWLPTGAVAFLKKAREAGGFFCWATYARGTWTKGEPRVADSVLVKGRAHGRGFVVLYLSTTPGTWRLEAAYRVVGRTATATPASQLKAWIVDPGTVAGDE